MFSKHLIEKLKHSKSLTVLTGAGISVESGIPAFRGRDGLWEKYNIEEIANFDTFINNPALLIEWFNFKEKLIYEIKPNAAHYALVKLEELYPNFHLITQNIDNLHSKAGNKRICQLHGNIMLNRCVDCNKRFDNIPLKNSRTLLSCECGGLIRPDIVWFGEPLPEKVLADSFEAAQNSEIFLSIGTSAVIEPAASLPITAKKSGAYIVEINIRHTVISSLADETIIGKSGEILPLLLEQIQATL